MRELESILVVEDSMPLQRALKAALLACHPGLDVILCGTAQQGREQLERGVPSLLLLDVHLPDGSAFELLEVVRLLRPRPVCVAMSGKASPDEAFRLARLGVSAYLCKPLELDCINETLDRVLAEAPDLEAQVRLAVGKIPVKEAERIVRSMMVDEALARSSGSRRGAARLLKISRELLQHILRGRG